ncbi:transposase [Chromobacterium sp. ATCC 53434]|uniref:transposase n=1 Tax=Chromobacterium sp. (strain ATCC 53434 / SC 14030) TaxID=2059672 RepID=UPI0035181819
MAGRPPFLIKARVRILVLKRLYNLFNEKKEYQRLDRMSYQRFYRPSQTVNIPNHTTIWTLENQIGEVGAESLTVSH